MMKMWPPIKSRIPIVQREFRGINKLDQFSINEVFASESRNISSANYPAMTIRPGTTSIGGVPNSRVLGMGVWKDKELHIVFADGTWRRYSGGTNWDILASGLDPVAKWSFTNFKGDLSEICLIGSNGIDGVRYYNGTIVQALSNAPAGANYIEQYGDRLWCAVKNTLHFSAYRMSNNWTTINQDDADPGFIEVETTSGEEINGVISNSTSLLITKPSSQHKLFGTSANDFVLRPVARGIGVLNNRSMVNIEGILYQADDGGIYEYSGSTLPDKAFSVPVQYYMERLNQTAKTGACVGTDGKRLYIGVPVFSAETNDILLVYDFIAHSWEVWEGFNPMCFAKMGETLYIGDYFGNVHKVEGTTDNGVPVGWRRISIPYGAQSYSQVIRFNRMWVVASVPIGSTLDIYLSQTDKGDTDWRLVKSISSDQQLESTTIFIPTGTLIDARWIRVKLEGTGPCEIKEFAREQQEMPIR